MCSPTQHSIRPKGDQDLSLAGQWWARGRETGCGGPGDPGEDHRRQHVDLGQAGAQVADHLYATRTPVLLMADGDFARLDTGMEVEVTEAGAVLIGASIRNRGDMVEI